MADEETKGEATETPSAKSGGLKTILIVAALMVAQAGGMFVVMRMMGGPKAADATELEGLEGSGEEAPVEIELVKGQYQNMSTGRVWEWRVEVFLRVRQKNVAEIERVMARDEALIQEGISKIFGRAQDRHLREPGRETMTRQLTAYLNEIFGVDPDEFPIVDRVLIPELKGFPADS